MIFINFYLNILYRRFMLVRHRLQHNEMFCKPLIASANRTYVEVCASLEPRGCTRPRRLTCCFPPAYINRSTPGKRPGFEIHPWHAHGSGRRAVLSGGLECTSSPGHFGSGAHVLGRILFPLSAESPFTVGRRFKLPGACLPRTASCLWTGK